MLADGQRRPFAAIFGVEDYQRMSKSQRSTSWWGSSTETFGSAWSWTPVLYQYKSFPRSEELLPLYGVSDDDAGHPCASRRMNLIAKEYVAAAAAERTQGVLVLSEMAGEAPPASWARRSWVNPNDIPEDGLQPLTDRGGDARGGAGEADDGDAGPAAALRRRPLGR